MPERTAERVDMLFLAPTGAQGEAMSVLACVRDIPQKNIENEL